jgi:predicted dinucleotide-binding enzyme
MARGIAKRALAGCHSVTVVGRSLAKAQELAEELAAPVEIATVRDPLPQGIVVLAVPYLAVRELVSMYAEEFHGRVLVDVTNPIDPTTLEPITVPAGSAAQELARLVPDATVVKAFNTTSAATLVRGVVAEHPVDVLVASDSARAKRAVVTIANDGGASALDVGPLSRARELEAMGCLHMWLGSRLASGAVSSVKVLIESDRVAAGQAPTAAGTGVGPSAQFPSPHDVLRDAGLAAIHARQPRDVPVDEHPLIVRARQASLVARERRTQAAAVQAQNLQVQRRRR